MYEFKKNIIIIFLFFILTNSSVQSEVINKIDIKGNERISKETIVIFGDIVIGKNYESPDVNSLIKKLYETSFFSDISVELKNNKLNIVVKENPIVNSIIFNGEKAKKHTSKIKELIQLKEKSSFLESYIKNDINIIKSFYKNSGYYFIEIDAEVEKLERNRVNLVYTLNKGEKAKIAKIYFLGDKKIREKKLRDVITSQENRFWKVVSRNIFLNKERINLDKRLLKSYYKNKGYYEVDIKSTNVEYAEGEGFVLTYNISAGKRYKFKKFFTNVADVLDQSAFVSLEPEYNKLIGKYYSQKKLKLILDKIDKLSEQKELQFINHNIVEVLDGSGVEVKINIFEGKKIIIERVNIIGNSVTNDSVIRSELIVDEGDPFSTLLVNKSINEIKARNIFGRVSHEILPGSSNDLKVLEITVEEMATGEIMAGAGIGTDGTSFQFAVSENNWLGRGIKLQSALNVTTQKISGSLSLNNPNYNYTGNSLSSSLDVSSTDRTSTSGFKSSKTGFSVGTSFEQYENIYIAPNISLAFEDIEVDSTASKNIKKMEGNFFNVDAGYTVTSDQRNQSFKPTKGHKISFNQSLPLVQDSSSIKNALNVTKYHEFTEDLIGSIKFYAAAINGIDDDVRLTNRLYVPRSRLRGFDTSKVGPKDGEDYIGGNYLTTLGAEAQFPNFLPESYKTDIGLFIDTANIWGVDFSDSVDKTNMLRSSIGISASTFTPIGPLSFTFAQNLTKSTNDETETFNFRLGTSF